MSLSEIDYLYLKPPITDDSTETLLDNPAPMRAGSGSLARIALSCADAFLKGAAKTTIFVGTITLLTRPNLNLLTIGLLGGAVNMAAEIFKHLQLRYPEVEIIKTLAQVTGLTTNTLIRLLGDLGITIYPLLLMESSPKESVMLLRVATGILTSLLMLTLSTSMSLSRHLWEEGKRAEAVDLNRLKVGFAGLGLVLRGGLHPLFALKFLQVNHVKLTVVVPILVTLGALWGMSTIAFVDRHTHWLPLDILELLFEYPAWAAAFFVFTNLISQSINNGQVANPLFYSSLVLSAISLAIFTLNKGLSIYDNIGSKKEAVADLENAQIFEPETMELLDPSDPAELFDPRMQLVDVDRLV